MPSLAHGGVSVSYIHHEALLLLRAARTLPNLTECFLKGDAPLPVAWTQQQRARILSVEVGEAMHCAVADVQRLPSLTNLKINFKEDCWPQFTSQQLVSLDLAVEAPCSTSPDIDLVKECAPRLTRLIVRPWRACDYLNGFSGLTALRDITLHDSVLPFNTEKLPRFLGALPSLTSLDLSCRIKDKPTVPHLVRSLAPILVAVSLPTTAISSELAEALYTCPKLRKVAYICSPSLPLLLPLAGRLNTLKFNEYEPGDEATFSLLKRFSSLTVLHAPTGNLPPELRMPRLVELKISCDYPLPALDPGFPSLLRLAICEIWDEYGLVPLIHACEQHGLERMELTQMFEGVDPFEATKELSPKLRWLTLFLRPQMKEEFACA